MDLNDGDSVRTEMPVGNSVGPRRGDAIEGINTLGKTLGSTVGPVCIIHCGGATASHLKFTHVKALLQQGNPVEHTW